MKARELATRIAAEVAPLAGRVKEAADFAELQRQKALPQGPVAAFVLPLGLAAHAEGEAIVNAFTQSLDELFAVILVVRAAGDVTGGKALPAIDALIWAVIAVVCGWAPEGEPDDGQPFVTGVFRLVRGELLSAAAGTIQYQLDFGLFQQVRIVT